MRKTDRLPDAGTFAVQPRRDPGLGREHDLRALCAEPTLQNPRPKIVLQQQRKNDVGVALLMPRQQHRREPVVIHALIMFGAKYLGAREAEIIAVSTATGDATITRFNVPSHYIYDFNLGYRKKIGRYHTSFQLNTANIADDDKFYGATWQVGRTYRLSATLNF